jgi:hypothetical protein
MLQLLATTRVLNYGTALLSKSHASLKRLAKLAEVPLLAGHSGSTVGVVSKLRYRKVGDIGQLWGEVPSDLVTSGHGFSLQYSGVPIGSRIQIQPDDKLHVAIVPDPRDTMTIQDAKKPIIFSDSAEVNADEPDAKVPDNQASDQEGETNSESTENPPTIDQGSSEPPSIEVDPDDLVSALLSSEVAIGSLTTALLANQGFIDQLLSHPSILEKLGTPPAKPTTKIIVSPRVPEQAVNKRVSVTPNQQPFKPVV